MAKIRNPESGIYQNQFSNEGKLRCIAFACMLKAKKKEHQSSPLLKKVFPTCRISYTSRGSDFAYGNLNQAS